MAEAWVEAVRELKRVVEAKFGSSVRQIKLFGSRARAAARPDSDIDLLVLMDLVDRQKELQVVDLAFEISLKYGVLLSPMVLSEDSYRARKQIGSQFVEVIEREGILI